MKIFKKFQQIINIMKLPRSVKSAGLDQIQYFYNNSATSLNENNVEWIARELRILTHTIEKGLSLPIVRKGFGKGKIQTILKYLDKYIEIDNFDYDVEAFTGAIAIVERYIMEADKHSCDITYINTDKYRKYYKNDVNEYGVREMRNAEALKHLSEATFEELAKGRHSIRSFSDKPLDVETVKKAIELAQTAPSACNRQPVRVAHICDKDLCKQILDIQGGAKGHSVSELLLVVSDLHLYRYMSETGTPYLDAGIFLMNLLYALTSYNIGSCPLIWNDYSQRGKDLRNIIKLPQNMHVVAVVQIGNYPQDGCNYAISRRKSISEIYFGEESVL
ncbi:MAG: nitroreductase family protein [Clostridia bacterium]|nr:nitroreductase family protein [Clostridia bacterium]